MSERLLALAALCLCAASLAAAESYDGWLAEPVRAPAGAPAAPAALPPSAIPLPDLQGQDVAEQLDALGAMAAADPGARLMAATVVQPGLLESLKPDLIKLVGADGYAQLRERSSHLNALTTYWALQRLSAQLTAATRSWDGHTLAGFFDGTAAAARAPEAFRVPSSKWQGLSRITELGRLAKTDPSARLLAAVVAKPKLLRAQRAEIEALIGPDGLRSLGARAAELRKAAEHEPSVLRDLNENVQAAAPGWKWRSIPELLAGLPALRPAEGAPAPAPAPAVAAVAAVPAPAARKPVALGPALSSPLEAGGAKRVHAIGGGEAGFVIDGRPAAQVRSEKRGGDLISRTLQHPDHPDILIKAYHSPSSFAGLERKDEKVERLATLSAAGVAPALLEHGEAAVPELGVVHFYAQRKVDGVKLSTLSAEEWPERALAGLLARLKKAGLALEAESREQLVDSILIGGGDEASRAYVTDGHAAPADGQALEDNQAYLAALLKPAAAVPVVAQAAPGAAPAAEPQPQPQSEYAAKIALLPDEEAFVLTRKGRKPDVHRIAFSAKPGHNPSDVRRAHGLNQADLEGERFLQMKFRLWDVRAELAASIVAQLAEDPNVASVEAGEDVRRLALGRLARPTPASAAPAAQAAESAAPAATPAQDGRSKLAVLPEDEATYTTFGKKRAVHRIAFTAKPGHKPQDLLKAHGLQSESHHEGRFLRMDVDLHNLSDTEAAVVVGRLAVDPGVDRVAAGREVVDALRKDEPKAPEAAAAGPEAAQAPILTLPQQGRGSRWFDGDKPGTRVLITAKAGRSLEEILKRHQVTSPVFFERDESLATAASRGEIVVDLESLGFAATAAKVAELAADPDVERLAAGPEMREAVAGRGPRAAPVAAVIGERPLAALIQAASKLEVLRGALGFASSRVSRIGIRIGAENPDGVLERHDLGKFKPEIRRDPKRGIVRIYDFFSDSAAAYVPTVTRLLLDPEVAGVDVSPAVFAEVSKALGEQERLVIANASPADALDAKTVGLAAAFRPIAPGSFVKGSPDADKDRWDNEPRGNVRLTQGFEMQATPVTQLQYFLVMGHNPSHFKEPLADVPGHLKAGAEGLNPDLPVDSIDYEHAKEFIRRLNELQSDYTYSLPTEAQWEYAARAGSLQPYAFGKKNPAELDRHAWSKRNSGKHPHPVGLKRPNRWGLFDVHGNVWELTQDYHDRGAQQDAVDPLVGVPTDYGRVVKGGAADSSPAALRATARGLTNRDQYVVGPPVTPRFIGLRLIRVPRRNGNNP